MPEHKALTRRQTVALVFASTLIAAAGQILIKIGATTLARSSPLAMLTDVPLMGGYALYGVFTLLFVYALRDEELGFVYPIISLSYVWVTGLSIWLFHEVANPFKLLGVLTIVAGVAVLGKEARK
jgi:drug/metabolite transporter (DMT)-like permease